MGNPVRQVFEGADAQMVTAGQCLYEAGSEPDAVFLVHSGGFTLYRDGAGGRRPVGERTEGSLIGEAAVLDGEPRTVTAEASRDATVLRLSAEHFRQGLREDATACYGVAVAIARTLRDSAAT